MVHLDFEGTIFNSSVTSFNIFYGLWRSFMYKIGGLSTETQPPAVEIMKFTDNANKK